MNKQAKKPTQNRFVEDARELGLDTPEAEAEFERMFGKIAPAKKPGEISKPIETTNKK